jgi:hypothetical protein
VTAGTLLTPPPCSVFTGLEPANHRCALPRYPGGPLGTTEGTRSNNRCPRRGPRLTRRLWGRFRCGPRGRLLLGNLRFAFQVAGRPGCHVAQAILVPDLPGIGDWPEVHPARGAWTDPVSLVRRQRSTGPGLDRSRPGYNFPGVQTDARPISLGVGREFLDADLHTREKARLFSFGLLHRCREVLEGGGATALLLIRLARGRSGRRRRGRCWLFGRRGSRRLFGPLGSRGRCNRGRRTPDRCGGAATLGGQRDEDEKARDGGQDLVAS